jgi:hypothetical protein
MTKKTTDRIALDLACDQISRKCSNCPVLEEVCFDKAPISCPELIRAYFTKTAQKMAKHYGRKK